jgi:hypothetical protein
MTDHHHSTATRSEHVMLELGDDVGALLLYTGPELHGREIEISSAGTAGERAHKQVHRRLVQGRAVHAAVFDHLGAGEYTLWLDGLPQEPRVHVDAGAITEVDWHSNQGGKDRC